MENLERLVNELRKLPRETPWLEFKQDNYTPDMIGEDISALANSAALHERTCAYMLWGIRDTDHEIVGTEYDLQTLKKGEQELENWLRGLLSKNAEFEFHSVAMNDKKVGVLIIYSAANQTVMFKKVDYIRIGSYTKKLNENPTLQAQLWDRIRNARFEEQAAKRDLEQNDALQLLDLQLYFDLSGIPQPGSAENVAHYLLEEGVLVRQDNGLYSITNMGALLLAKRLSEFPRLARKAIRVVRYQGGNRLHTGFSDQYDKGYAACFDGLIHDLEVMIPSKEVIVGAVREWRPAYPLLAIREAVANALIHQDFSITGTGPVVELFEDRIEITNSGIPLVNVQRIVDNPPRSRNEKLAALMRRLRMCEELGTGWDKIVLTCELSQLPAPQIDLYEDSMRVTLYGEMPFSNISLEDKLWACYLHACIMHVQGGHLTNSSLRTRFGLKDSAAGNVSRLIKEAVNRQLIKPLDPSTAPRYMKYLPYWA